MRPRVSLIVPALFVLSVLAVSFCHRPQATAPEQRMNPVTDHVMDAKLVGVWQNQNDDKEYFTFRDDGTLRWFYQGVPGIGLADSIMERTYKADPSQRPGHLDLYGLQPLWKNWYCVYAIDGDELRIGFPAVGFEAGNRPQDFGLQVRRYRRVD